ncbi:MAG: ABC transporter ATP-binding protein, partial [Floccifex sp.]
NYKAMGFFMAGNNFFQGLLYITVLVGGGYCIAYGNLNVTDLATFALYIGIFISPIEVLVELTEMFQKGISGFTRFEEVLEENVDICEKENPFVFENMDGHICFENVSFQYNQEEKVLTNVSLDIPAGKKLALVGPSGAGKSTLCSLIPRFYDVDSGRITIDGMDIRDCSLQSLRSNIGIVQQDVYLFTGSIAQNIGYGKENASMEEIIEAAKKANIHDFIVSLPDGYQTFVGQRGVRLSGGQKQRISIARVFLKDPKILILDEATSALDNESERIIQKSLEELSKNRTCITIAHRLSTIQNADEILVVDQEGIKEKGSHEDLMKKNGIYANYYRLQFEK